jgi:hypothetical protein
MPVNIAFVLPPYLLQVHANFFLAYDHKRRKKDPEDMKLFRVLGKGNKKIGLKKGRLLPWLNRIFSFSHPDFNCRLWSFTRSTA